MIRKKILALVVVLVILVFAVYQYAYNRAQKLPDNNPKQFLKKERVPGEKVLVCIGDSITHGRVSVSYVDILRQVLADKNIEVVNAGINGETAWNVLKRVDDIAACNPDYITILIGTNDANGSFSEKVYKRQVKDQGLQQRPDKVFFRNNLEALCETLKKRTKAKIALLSIPIIGEEPEHPAFKNAEEFSRIIRETATKEEVTYLPLNEVMTDLLVKSGHRPKLSYSDEDYIMYKSIARNFLLGQSFDRVSQIHGYYFLTDPLHLNGRGARVVALLIEAFINEQS
jgi:lysophospholipase L1-like esterase